MSFRPLLLLAAVALLRASAHAQIEWEAPVKSFERTPEDGHVEARYAFKNAGPAPVTIKSLRSSCGCTTARLEKKTYAPGERGEVVLKFTFGDRKGLQQKGVTVVTDPATPTPVVLGLRVNITQPVTLTPALVWWRVGAPAEAKTVQVAIAPGSTVRVKSVSSSSPRIAARILSAKPGEPCIIGLTPTDTTARETAEITVQTDFPADAPRAYTIHARIK
jgi:hypothetical protein